MHDTEGSHDPTESSTPEENPLDYERPDITVREAGSHQAFAMACHLSTLVTYCFRLAWFNIPGVIAPLVLWQLIEARHKPAVYHAKEAFNFQLNVLGWLVVSWLLTPLCCVGYGLGLAVTIANVVLTVIAAVQAAEGERYRYPGIIRVLGK